HVNDHHVAASFEVSRELGGGFAGEDVAFRDAAVFANKIIVSSVIQVYRDTRGRATFHQLQLVDFRVARCFSLFAVGFQIAFEVERSGDAGGRIEEPG